MWVGFADHYLSALDLVARNGMARPKRDWADAEWGPRQSDRSAVARMRGWKLDRPVQVRPTRCIGRL